MVANLDAYKSGQVAMQMNWFAFFPGHRQGPRGRWASDKSGFFVNPDARTCEASTLGGQGISVVAYSDKTGPGARSTSSGSPKPEVQKKWWSLGGYSCHVAVLERSGTSPTPRPSPPTSSKAMSGT